MMQPYKAVQTEVGTAFIESCTGALVLQVMGMQKDEAFDFAKAICTVLNSRTPGRQARLQTETPQTGS